MFAKQCSHSNPRRLHLSPRCGSRPPSSVESDHVPARCARHRSASDPLLPRIHGTSLRPGTACGGCNMTWPDCMSRTINKKAPSMCQIICIIFFASISHIWNRFDAILSIFNVHGFSHGICLRLTSNQTSASWMAPTHPTPPGSSAVPRWAPDLSGNSTPCASSAPRSHAASLALPARGGKKGTRYKSRFQSQFTTHLVTY